MIKVEYTVVLEIGEDNYWVAHVPALSGCHSQGKTREEALTNIKEAIELYIETLLSYGDPIPPSTKKIEIHKVSIEVSVMRSG